MTLSLPIPSHSAIGTYNDLLAFIPEALDSEVLVGNMPSLVRLCEDDMNLRLRIPQMEVIETITAAAGEASLPLDCLGLLSARMVGKNYQLRSTSMSGRAPYVTLTGDPIVYALAGSNPRKMLLGPAGAGDIEIVYWQRIEALSTTNPTNWVLEECSLAYYYGTIAQAEMFLVNDERAGQAQALYVETLERLKLAGHALSFGATPQMSSPVQTVRGVNA
jgi:hypothetical protein